MKRNIYAYSNAIVKNFKPKFGFTTTVFYGVLVAELSTGQNRKLCIEKYEVKSQTK